MADPFAKFLKSTSSDAQVDVDPESSLVQMDPSGQRSYRNKNVFNVEYHDWMQPYGATLAPDKRFAQFPNFEAGVQAATDLIKRNYAGMTIKEGIQKFAPKFQRPDGSWENPNTPQRIRETAAHFGATPDTPIGQLPLGAFMQFLAKYESPSKINPAVWGDDANLPINLAIKRAGAIAATVDPFKQFLSNKSPETGTTPETPPPVEPKQGEVAVTTDDPFKQFSGGQSQRGAVQEEGTAANPAHGGIPGLLHKVFFGGGLDQAKKNIERWTGPQGIQNFNEDITNALQSPEALAFSSLDPMVALTTPVKATPSAVSPATKELGTLEKVVGMEKFDPAEMQRLKDTAKGFGIDLTVPELTNSPTLRGLWTRLAKTPGPQSEKLAAYLEEVRNPQVEAAIRRELGNISPSSLTSFQAGAQARGAARNIEEGLKTTRKVATQPLYKAAFANPQPVETGEIIENLSQQVSKYPEGHPSRAALQQVDRMLTEGNQPITDLETLHNAKTGIDQLLEKAKAEKSIDNDTRRLLMQVKSKLQGRMEADNPLYGRAQGTFRLLSKPLNDFRYGNPNIQPRDPHIKTMIAQIADLGDEAFEKAPGIIFGGNTPGKIARTKEFFDKNYPGTWDALVRTRLEEKLNGVSELVSQREGNVGGAFKRAVFQNQNEREKWQAALGKDKFKRLESFMEVLDKTRRIIYTNSETPFQIKAGEILDKGGFEEFVGNVSSFTSPKGVLGKAFGWVARRMDNLNKPEFAARLADAMLDPQNAIELTKLRKMADTPRKAIATAQWLDTVIYKGEGLGGGTQ